MRPRAVDWALFFLVTFALATGFYSLTVSHREGRFLFYVHGGAGLALLVLVFWKLRRVVHRVVQPARWEWATLVSLAVTLLVLAIIGTGVVWAVAERPLGYPNGMNLHIVLALLLIPLYLLHLFQRGKPLRWGDLGGRRMALRSLGALAFGGIAWQGQEWLHTLLRLPGACRRFTGSYEVGSDLGNDGFPPTSWMLDNPAPVDVAVWRLRVTGAVARELSLTYNDLLAHREEERALLDCTSGWYTVQEWQGVRVGRLLEQAAVRDDAIAVGFISLTGYRWSVPLAEARRLLLATHVAGEPLAHGHGAPLRLVAPGRRGFQWVKWVSEVRVLTQPDWAQWLAIFTSSI